MAYYSFRKIKAITLSLFLLTLVFILACGGAAATPVVVEKQVPKEVPKEVVKEVAKEVVKEVVKEVAKEVMKEVVVATVVPAPAAPVVAEKLGGIITMQKHADYSNLDPHPSKHNTSAPEWAPMYNQLVQYSEVSPTEEIVSDLAKSWEVSADGLSYTFQLHDNVKWWDGKDLTSEDVVFSLNRMVKEGMPRSGLIRPYYDRSDAVGSHAVEVRLKFPSGAFLFLLGSNYNKILPKHVVESGVDLNVGENVVGSGPFKFVKYVKGDSIEYEKNPNYFKEGMPYVDGLAKFIMKDHGRIIAAFQTEQVLVTSQGWSGLSVPDTIKLGEDNADKLTSHQMAEEQMFGFYFNTSVAPMDDVRFRRALFLAVDRQATVDAITGGLGSLQGPLMGWSGWGMSQEQLSQVPGYRYTPDGKKDPRDIEEAKRLLKEAGLEGAKITMKLRTVGQYADSAAMVKFQLKEVGIDLELVGMESAAGLAAFYGSEFELFNLAGVPPYPDPDIVIQHLYLPEGSRNNSDPPWDYPGFRDLYDKQMHTGDPVERRNIVDEIEKILLFEDPGTVVTLYGQPNFWIRNHKVKNWDVPFASSFTGLKWETAWLDQ